MDSLGSHYGVGIIAVELFACRWITRQGKILAHTCASVAWPMAQVPHDGGNDGDGLGNVAMTRWLPCIHEVGER